MDSLSIPQVRLTSNKTKNRAEVQSKFTLTLNLPLENVAHIRFPRKLLSKPKQFANDKEREEVEKEGGVLDMNLHLVCATAVESAEGRARALRRAAGVEAFPRRPAGLCVSKLDRDAPEHPQNGGQVLICKGCKKREYLRYRRKTKEGSDEDEEEYANYADERVIMVNEKEYMRLKEVGPAKEVKFNMRITCYCRHQEEKQPMGFRIIFTFMEGQKLLTQHLSDVFHVADDHKNKEPIAPEAIAQQARPVYQYAEDPFLDTTSAYPQTSPSVMTNFAPTMSPMDATFPQSVSTMPQTFTFPVTPTSSTAATSPMSPIDNGFSQAAAPTMQQQYTRSSPTFPMTSASYERHQRGQSYYATPAPSPTETPFETNGLFRNHSMGNFGSIGNFSSLSHFNNLCNFDSMGDLDTFRNFGSIGNLDCQGNFDFRYGPNNLQFPYAQQNQYASAPPSAGGTPINLSRPPSPTFEQAPSKKGKIVRCVYYYADP